MEIKLLLDKMDLVSKEIVAGFIFYIGKIETKNVVVTCCSIGKVNAASCTQVLITKFGVDYINGVPFLVIRCISDNSDESATMSYEKFENIAAKQSAAIVLNIINIL